LIASEAPGQEKWSEGFNEMFQVNQHSLLTMEQKANVYQNGELAGILTKQEGKYTFSYVDAYFTNRSKPAISLSFPKNQRSYESSTLFAFFYGLLSEGTNKEIQCKALRIDEKDAFTRLIRTAHTETIGAITVREIQSV
jgi:serine/threonine-protein kinase HipA